MCYVCSKKDLLFILNVIFSVLLGVVAFQDIKTRKVTAILFLLLAVTGGYLHFGYVFFKLFLFDLGVNFSFLLLLTLILVIYIKLKMKKNSADTIGLGDIYFFCVLAVSFPTITFMVLFSTSLLFSLILFLLLKPKLKMKTVPLAGFQSLFLILIIITNFIFHFVNLYTF